MHKEHKEKSKKSAPSGVEFPVGSWEIQFTLENTNDKLAILGGLCLACPENPIGNTLTFDNNPHYEGIANGTFPINIISYDIETGLIHFQILGAADLYKPHTPPPYQFYFKGVYAYNEKTNQMEFDGTGTAPLGFYPGRRLPDADGDNVTWTSGGPVDPPHKPSR